MKRMIWMGMQMKPHYLMKVSSEGAYMKITNVSPLEWIMEKPEECGKYSELGARRCEMGWATGKGIITGKNGITLDPQGTSTRGEAAAVVQRFVEAYK